MNPKRVAYNKEMEEYNKKRDKQSGLEQSSSEVKNVVVEKKD